MLLRLQSAEVDAAPFQLDGRTCDDGLLRADALQQPPWHRGHRRHEDVLRVADAGALENLRDALRFFWCCTGTGAEEFGKFGDTIYFHDGQGLYVNLFIASELSWPEKKVTVVQETGFPEEEGTSIMIKTAAPVKMPVHVRAPYWATRGVTVSVNGKKQEVTARPSSYFTLDRTWNDGDKIQVAMPMGLHLAPLPDEPTLQAAMYGPLVLAGRLGTKGLTHEHVYGPLGPDEARNIPVPPLTGSVDAPDWVEQVKGQTLAFQTVGQKSEIDVSPFYQVNDERYTVYWKVNRKSA